MAALPRSPVCPPRRNLLEGLLKLLAGLIHVMLSRCLDEALELLFGRKRRLFALWHAWIIGDLQAAVTSAACAT